MARPVVRNYTQLPIASYAGWDNAIDVETILRTHEFGNFKLSGLFADALLRDDRIYGVSDTRVGGMMGAPLEIKPAMAKRKAAKIAEQLGGVSDVPGQWEELFPPDTLAALWRYGHFVNIAVADIVWEGSRREWKPRLRLWHPQHVWWNWQTFSYWVITAEGSVELPNVGEKPNSDGQWVVWCPKGYSYGWMHGLVRPLGKLSIMRGWNYRDWARYNEIHGQAIRKAVVPMDAEEKLKIQHFDNVRSMGSETTIMVPQEGGESARKFDVQYEEAKSRSWEGFKDFKSNLDTDIAIVVLGQNLTTEVKGGSFAAAQTHELIRADKKAEDAGLYRCLRQQVLYWWALYNFGDPELAPRAVAQIGVAEDEATEMAGLKSLGEAIQALQLAEVPVDIRTLADRAGVPMLSEEDQQAQKDEDDARALAIAQGQAGGGNDGNGDGDGGGDPGAVPNVAPERRARARAKLVALAALPRRSFAGLDVAIEHPAGSVRRWVDNDGREGQTTMVHDYGFLVGHTGADGEEVDVYLGPHEDAADAHVVHQLRRPGYDSFDEDKVMLGFGSADAARAAYVAHRDDGARAIKGMSSIPIERFKAKLRRRRGTGQIRAVALARTPAGRRRASRYLLQLERNARAQAAASIRPDLELLHQAITAATDYHDLKRRLLSSFRGMAPQAFAGVVAKAHVMAQLAGRGDALEEV